VRHATSHTTRRAAAYASALVWPLVLFPLINGPTLSDDPLFVLLFASIIIMFIIWLWAMHKVEVYLNAEGESMFYPWRVPSTKKETRRVDGVLSTSIRRLRSGEDEVEVAATLRRNAGGLQGESRKHLDRALLRLQEASGRDWVFDKERREKALEEAEKALLMARAEYLREMI
jgi:hypothetical protein